MLENPLKKNKHSYPIDFQNKRKDPLKKSPTKYDVISFDEVNPQKKIDKKSFAVFSGSSISQLFIESNKKPQQKNDSDFTTSRQVPTSILNPLSGYLQKIQFVKDILNVTQNEEPLKEIKKKTHRIIIDQNKLKNPKIQMHQQITIATNQMTIQPVSLQKIPKSENSNLIGSIQRQNFQIFEQFQEQKQNPLHPQKPFNFINKNIKRNSFLQKLNLTKKSHEFQNINISQISPQKKVFRPQTYTYANRILASSQSKLQKIQKTSRNNSFQQIKKKDNIIFANTRNIGSLSFNLRNIPLVKDASLSKSTQQSFLPSKIKNQTNSFLPLNRENYSKGNQEQNGNLFEPNQINALKNQINLIAKNRLRNRSDFASKISQVQRQLPFQSPQKSKQQIRGNNDFGKLKQIIKKPNKKLQITFHVPLAKLKGISRTYLSQPDLYSLAFKVPKIFMQVDLFSKCQSKEQVHENGVFLFDSLRINSKQMVIKRYSNCLMFISNNIVVIWYYNGKRYLGGWQYDYLDQGSRHGLGLQWQPNVFIYYGQFRNNKRHGLGLMKQGPQKLTVGYWNDGKYKGTQQRQFQQHEFNESQIGQIQEQQSTDNQKSQSPHYYEYDE